MSETGGANSVDRRTPSVVGTRRIFLIGSTAGIGTVLLGSHRAAASPQDKSWTRARVESRTTRRAVNVFSLDTGRSLVVSLSPQALVKADLSPGKQIMIEGDLVDSHTIAARRVVRGVFGKFSDIQR